MDDSWDDDLVFESNPNDKENDDDFAKLAKEAQATQKRLQEGLVQFTQRIQHGSSQTQRRGKRVEPSNDFERFLLSVQVEIMRDADYKRYLSYSGATFETLVSSITEALKDQEKSYTILLDMENLMKDTDNLQLYLSPINSNLGQQETLIRVLLLSESTQNFMFSHLLSRTSDLATATGKEAEKKHQLAEACVSQARYLDRVFDCEKISKEIFEREIGEWAAGPRDFLVDAIPELLVDPLFHGEAAIKLQNLILTHHSESQASLEASVFSALRLLRLPTKVSEGMRETLCENIMRFAPQNIPDMIFFLIQTLEDDRNSSFSKLLGTISSYWKVDEMVITRTSKTSADEIVMKVNSILARHVQLEGQKGWRAIGSFLRSCDSSNEEEEPDFNATADAAVPTHVFSLFDVLLTMNLMSVDGCPASLMNHMKNQIINNADNLEPLKAIFKKAFAFKKFCTNHASHWMQFAKVCIWCDGEANREVRSFGASIYANLYLVITQDKEEILSEMLAHISNGDDEAEAILGVVEDLISNHFQQFAPAFQSLEKLLRLFEELNYDNIKRIFRIFFNIYTKDRNQTNLKRNVESAVKTYLFSITDREVRWGTIGKLVVFEQLLKQEPSDTRERNIAKILSEVTGATSKCCSLKSFFFNQMDEILKDNFKATPSSSVLSWTDELMETFKQEFIVVKPAYNPANEWEQEKYAMKEVKLWLKTSPEKLIMLVPMFELLKQSALIKQRWGTEDDTQMAYKNHWSLFFFAFEANISMDSIKSFPDPPKRPPIDTYSDTLYFTIEWIRTIINMFACQNTVDGVDDSRLGELWKKKFALMFECQKLLMERMGTIDTWQIPNSSTQSDSILIQNTFKPPLKKSRKRSKPCGEEGNEPEVKNEGAQPEVEENEEDNDEGENTEPLSLAGAGVVKKRKVISLPRSALLTRLSPLRLVTVVRLLELVFDKRKATTFLLEQLMTISHAVMPRKDTKQTTFWAKKNVPVNNFHGDSATIWKLVLRVTPLVYKILNNVVSFFQFDLNDSDMAIHEPQKLVEIAALMKTSLRFYEAAFSWRDVSPKISDNERTSRTRKEKRRLLAEKLEHAILQERASQEESEDSERTILEYFINAAGVVPDIDCAVALLDTTNTLMEWTPELKKKLADHTLQYLKREWRDEEGHPLKGAVLSKPVKCILEHYLQLRPEDERLACMQWLIANKVSELVPEGERRRSKMSSYEDSGDPELSQLDKGAIFACITKQTVHSIYKVLFTSLNSTVQTRLMNIEQLRLGVRTPKEVFHEWKLAANIFCLLGLILRVKHIRNSLVLLTAVKEGRMFLFKIFHNNSSFMYLMRDNNLAGGHTGDINAIIKALQLGNRTLQNIGVYAKTVKSSALLKSIPDLRAANEFFIRTVQKAFVNLNCHDAFEIGLLKSRNIDGEEICVETRENTEEYDDTTATADNDAEEENDEENQNPDEGEESDSSVVY